MPVPGVVGPAHGVHDMVPQLAGLVFSTQSPLQRWRPALHWMPQLTPLQVAMPVPAVVGPAQGVQAVRPQLATFEFEAHAPLQAWKPMSQAKPQPPSAAQVGLELAGTGHAVHERPQLAGLESDRHCPLHS